MSIYELVLLLSSTPWRKWIVSKDGEEIKKRAPKNFFGERDFYTVYDEKGNRHLEFEHMLKKIEDGFLCARFPAERLPARDSRICKRLFIGLLWGALHGFIHPEKG